MNYGHYFILSTDYSDIARGVFAFDYNGIKAASAKDIHHIYMTIREDCLSVAYHYYSEKESKHLDCDIVSWPLSSNALGQRRLIEVIDECHDVIFPNEIGLTVSFHDPMRIGGYSVLPEFNVGKPESDGYIVRRMVLDFLFDLEHSEVFQSLPFFDHLQSVISENPLTSLLLAKAEYYYQRDIQLSKAFLLKGSPQSSLVYADDYSDAEKRWVEVLSAPSSDRLLAESPWFGSKGARSSVTKELNAIYDGKRRQYSAGDYVYGIKSEVDRPKCDSMRHRIRQTAKAATRAYLHRYYLPGLFHIWYGRMAWMASILAIFMISSLLLFFFSNADVSGYPAIWYSIVPMVAFWVFSCVCGRRRRLRSIGVLECLLPRLFAAIFAAWFTIFQYMKDSMGDMGPCTASRAIIIMIIVLFLYVFFEIKGKNLHVGPWNVLIRTVVLIAVSYIYAFLVGRGVMRILQEPDCVVSRSKVFLFTTIAVFIGVFIQMLFDKKSITES